MPLHQGDPKLDYDGSWADASVGWPHVRLPSDEDAKIAHNIAWQGAGVPYGSYVLVGRDLRLETVELRDAVAALLRKSRIGFEVSDAEYKHPASGAVVTGRRMFPGEELHTSDVYNSTSGHWELCSCPGVIILDGSAVTWVRPKLPARGGGILPALAAIAIILVACSSSLGPGLADGGVDAREDAAVSEAMDARDTGFPFREVGSDMVTDLGADVMDAAAEKEQPVTDARVESIAMKCVVPPGWLGQAAVCLNSEACAVCHVANPEDRDSGYGTQVSGCVLGLAGGLSFRCEVDCATCVATAGGDR